MDTCKYCGREAGPDTDICTVCRELDAGGVPTQTPPTVLRHLAAGHVVALEAVGRDIIDDRCPVCDAPVMRVMADTHRTLFKFGIGGAYRHECGQPDPTRHPGDLARERRDRDGDQLARLTMYVERGL
jgi:hypothetical protein